MVWDSAAETMAVNVIAKVEGSGAWDAINYHDPITIGLMQWYGTRAAGLLNRIKDGNATEYAKIAGSLRSAVESHAASSGWWTSRYLTGTEGKSLKPVLRACKDIQSALVHADMINYKEAAENLGYDLDKNTQSVIFFMCMYHQTPARAIRIARTAGLSASLDRLYSVCMNDGTFGQYKSRYTQARDYIKSGNPPDIIDLNDDDNPGGDSDGTEPGEDEDHSTGNSGSRVKAAVKYLFISGDRIGLKMKDNSVMWANPATPNYYILKASANGSTPIVDDGTGDDTGDSGGAVEPDPSDVDPNNSEKQNQLLAFAKKYLGKWDYTNGPARTHPITSGATDCSGFVKAAYASIGIKLAQITSGQYTQGRRVASSANPGNFKWSDLQVGDLVYIKWKNGSWNSPKVTDHVEMYAGKGQFVGQPGPPGKFGPRYTPVSTYTPLFRNWWVQRHL